MLLKNVNFSITIGTAIPRDIQRAPLPAAVLDVYPAWRGYEFIVVGNEILIIDPPTLRIVAITRRPDIWLSHRHAKERLKRPLFSSGTGASR